MVGFETKTFIPSIPSDPKKFAQSMTQAANATTRQIRSDFARTTRNWKTKVKFNISQKQSGGSITFTAFTDNEIYGYVNDGTEPHDIVAKNAPFLSFRVGGTAKTKVGSLRSGKGKRGKKFVQKRAVKHPGTEARKFDEIIAARFRDRWVKESNKRLRQYLRTNTRPAGR
jgi:hypothetical protein